MTIWSYRPPARTTANGIKPFARPPIGPGRPPGGSKVWTPPVPEPLPPAPLLDLRALGLIAIQALIWSWGQLNSRPKLRHKAPPGVAAVPTGTWDPNGVNKWVVRWAAARQLDDCRVTTFEGFWEQITSGSTAGDLVWVEAQTPSTGHNRCGNVFKSYENDWFIYRTKSVGDKTSGALASFVRLGNFTISGTVVVSVTVTSTSAGARPLPDWEVEPLPGYLPEEVPEVRPLPPPPLLVPAPVPVPLPEGEPVTPPVTPPVTVPVQVPTTTPRPVPPPVKIPGTTETDNGTLVKPRPLPIPTTPPGWTIPWPGADPIPDVGVGPRPDLIGIAAEVGKIERKLEIMNGGGGRPPAQPGRPLDLWELAQRILEFLTAINAETTYRLTGPCETDANGAPLPAVEVDVPGDDSALGVIRNRVDAIAALLQVHKDLKQPICKPERIKPAGQWVTVNFLSDAPSPGGQRPLAKRLRYLDQSGRDQLEHVEHWEAFVWHAGPVCVISKGLTWGVPQVWAASEAEGKRVIGHAAAIAGVDLEDPAHEWVVTGSRDPRYGQTGIMRTARRNTGLIRVSKRDGPSTLPGLYGVSPDP